MTTPQPVLAFRLAFRFLFAGLFFFGCASPKMTATGKDFLPAVSLKPFGRTVSGKGKTLELISSASHFGFSFEGTECRVEAAVPPGLDHNYLQYELDGVYQKRLQVSSKTAEGLVIRATNGGRHTLWIYKATEAHTGAVLIQGIAGNNLHVLQRPAAPLIEFIGNSITCGAAADPSEVPCGTGAYHDQHNAYLAYGPRVARTVGANFLLSSVSGIGIYRNWNSEGPTMPEVYEKTDFQTGSEAMWDFSSYTPAVVSIALGTNDFSRGDGKKERLPFDSTRFVDAFVPFVQRVKAKYPSAKIALLSSPMINGEARRLLQNCVLAVKQKIDAMNPAAVPVAVHFFKPMQARGCSGHPNVEDHALLAEELIPFFRQLLH